MQITNILYTYALQEIQKIRPNNDNAFETTIVVCKGL